MKKATLIITFLFATASLFAQKLTTTSATIVFDATTPIDDLPKAENRTVIGSFDKTTGTIAFEAAVNNFAFTNPRMQEHFNGANWMNSTTFPKFSFKGGVEKLSNIKFKKNGTYTVTVTGDLTVKGVTKSIKTPTKFIVKDGGVTANTSFSINLADYSISGQPVESGKVAKEPKISVSASF